MYAKYTTVLQSYLGLHKSVKQWGRVCVQCEGRRSRRAGSLTSACSGCNSNCSGSHLPNMLSCCSLHFPDKVYMTGSYDVVFVEGELRQTQKRKTKFCPGKLLKCRMNAHVQQYVLIWGGDSMGTENGLFTNISRDVG